MDGWLAVESNVWDKAGSPLCFASKKENVAGEESKSNLVEGYELKNRFKFFFGFLIGCHLRQVKSTYRCYRLQIRNF